MQRNVNGNLLFSRPPLALALALTASFTWLAAVAPAQPVTAAPASNAIMGFETPAAWFAKGNASKPANGSATTARTQGSFAYALANPANLTTLTSLPVPSTATALRGIGDVGAVFQVDVTLPLVQGNPVNHGSLKLFVSSPSRHLNNEMIEKVDFDALRLGIYTTIGFPIPDKVRTALGGAAFDDLTFEFMISSPGNGDGTYLFDNLRVHSAAPLVTANAGTQPPPGYGGSVDLVAIGSTPATALFDAGPVQVPDGFHLKLGTAGSTTVQLDLGNDGTPSFTCAFMADTSDASGKSYKPMSCTGGFQPGDLVGASWARLTIAGGDSTMKLRAQLARNPVGDLVGGGVIPAMPTYWGGFDGCVPVAVPNGAFPPVASTPSASCAAQTAEANAIVIGYFNKVNNGQFAKNWVVTPVPESALRHGDASPVDYIAGVPPPPNDPDFDQGGHVNEGGSFDAYWRMNGFLVPLNQNGHNTTTFDMVLSGHAVLFGQDVNVLSIEAKAKSDSGKIGQETVEQPSASGSLDAFVFGVQLYHADVSPSVSIDLSKNVGDNFTVEASIWVFDLKLSASASAGLDVKGTLSFAGASLQVKPHATIGLHAYGGIGFAGVISGGVEVTIPRLLDVNIAAGILLSWHIATDPIDCGARLDFQVLVTANILSDGGDISLVASFGFCPFCLEVSHSIFSWGPILESHKTIFEYNSSAPLFDIDVAACTAPLNIIMGSPAPGASFLENTPFGLLGSAGSSNGGGQVPCTPLNNDLTWTLSSGGTFVPPGANRGCSTAAMFSGPGTHTVSLSATHAYNSPSGLITESGGPVSATVNITPLPPGVYIQYLTEPGNKVHALCQTSYPIGGGPPVTICSSLLPVSQPISGGSYELIGLVKGATQPTCTVWTALAPGGTTTIIPGPSGAVLNPSADPSSITSAVLWTPSTSVPDGIYTITMTTANGDCGSGGTTFGSAQLTVSFLNVK